MTLTGSQPIDRVPPQSLEAERSVLGSMLIEKDALTRGMEELRDEDFYWESHRLIFRTMQELYDQAQVVDLVTLTEGLRNGKHLEQCGGATYLAELTTAVPTASHISHYAKIVRQRALLRGVIRVGTHMAQTAYEADSDAEVILDGAERELYQLSQRQGDTATAIRDVLLNTVSHIDQYYAKGLTGVTTGFSMFDKLTSGLQKSELIVIAARPSVGKTALALNLARNAAESKVPVALFSLEMGREQLAIRLICAHGGIDSQKLRQGLMEEEDWKRFSWAVSQLSTMPMFIDDAASLNVLELRAKCRRMKHEHGLGLVIVDYLQLLEARTQLENRQQEISAISRALKSLARELEVPVVTLSQLSRAVEQRSDHRPMLSDLRESGAIEQDADLVAFIYREQYYQKTPGASDVAEIVIAKQRNGPIGTVRLLFREDIGRFFTLDEQAEAAE
ncbi:MAG: replicative DNA helicase [Sulfobacillus sp.]